MDDRTLNKNWQLPHASNALIFDVARLRAALTAIDNDLTALENSVHSDAEALQGAVNSQIAAMQASVNARLAVIQTRGQIFFLSQS